MKILVTTKLEDKKKIENKLHKLKYIDDLKINIIYEEKYKKNEFFKKIIKDNYDHIINLRCKYIYTDKELNKIKNCYNLHPSLPKYRGMCGYNLAILNKDKHHGITFHKIDKKIDNGKILKIKKFVLNKNTTLEKLIIKTHNAQIEFLLKIIKDLKKYINIEKKYNSNVQWSNKYYGKKNLDEFSLINLDAKSSKYLDLKQQIKSFHRDSYPLKIKINNVYYKLVKF